MKLQCIIMTPVFPDVAWYKDGQLLEIAKTSLKQQSNGLYSAELEIRSAQYSDTGFYTCMVQNLFGINSGNVTLKVKGNAKDNFSLPFLMKYQGKLTSSREGVTAESYFFCWTICMYSYTACSNILRMKSSLRKQSIFATPPMVSA